MAATLPIKTRILEWCIENDRPVTAIELSDILSNEYPGEATASAERIDKQMDLYCKIGFLEPKDVKEHDGQPQVLYQVTESGKNAEKYIPGHGNKLI